MDESKTENKRFLIIIQMKFRDLYINNKLNIKKIEINILKLIDELIHK